MAAKRRGGRSRRKKTSAYAATPKVTLTSVPTGRAAYTDTRLWLLDQHGPICAYCESVIPIRSVTLDHVTPRRGQTAYDRRDNLVLCCKACNAAKKDTAILAFLLGSKKRVIAMYKYGQHLSHQLVEMVKDLLPEDQRPPIPAKYVPPKPPKRRPSAREVFGDLGRDGDPYLDDPAPAPRPRASHAAHPKPAAHAKPAHAKPVAHAAPAVASEAPKKRRRRGGRGRRKPAA